MNLSPEKVLVIAVLALLVLGPDRLPQAARTVGRAMGELRKLSSGLQGELRGALEEPEKALAHAVDEFGIRDLRSAVRSPVRSIAASFAAPPVEAPRAAIEAAPAPAAPVAAGEPPPPDDPGLN